MFCNRQWFLWLVVLFSTGSILLAQKQIAEADSHKFLDAVIVEDMELEDDWLDGILDMLGSYSEPFSYSIESKEPAKGDSFAYQKISITFKKGLTVRQSLNILQARLKDFTWSVDRGVVNIVQRGLLKDPNWPLNKKIKDFKVKTNHVFLPNDLADHVPGLPHCSVGHLLGANPSVSKSPYLRMNLANVTARDVLNAYISDPEVRKIAVIRWKAWKHPKEEAHISLSILYRNSPAEEGKEPASQNTVDEEPPTQLQKTR